MSRKKNAFNLQGRLVYSEPHCAVHPFIPAVSVFGDPLLKENLVACNILVTAKHPSNNVLVANLLINSQVGLGRHRLRIVQPQAGEGVNCSCVDFLH